MTPVSIAKVLLTVVAVLLMANLAFLFLKHRIGWDYHSADIFYFNKEGNIPTVYSSVAMLIAAAFLWLISQLPSEKRSKRYWKFLSFVFIFLSMDELLSIHETLTDNTRGFLGSNPTGFFHFAWIIPYLILCVIIASTLFRFLSMLPRGTRYLFIVAAATFVLGAVGLEMAGGKYVFTNGDESRNDVTYSLIVTAEELLEMIGVVIFNYALSCYYFHHLSRRTRVTFEVGTNKQYLFNLTPEFRKDR